LFIKNNQLTVLFSKIKLIDKLIMTSSVYPLAFPKGSKLLCELCQKPAHKVCENCRVTYYWYNFKISLYMSLKKN
jgi:hypothetical protein